MATSKVVYSGELRTISTHLASGSEIITDAPIDNHGKGEAFSPTDTAATSLASCMMTVIGIYAEANGINMTGSSAEVTKIMSTDGPRRIAGIIVNLEIKTTSILDEKERLIFERIARTCPVSLSLHPDLKQTIEIRFTTH